MPKIVSLDLAPTSDISVYGALDDKECVGTIAMVVRDHMNAATVTSLLHTDFSFLEPQQYIDRTIIQGNVLTLQRNEAVQRMKGNFLLFIDDDAVWAPGAVRQLIAAQQEIDADIIGGLTYRRSSPHAPTLFMREMPFSGGYNFLEDWESDIVEVDATGMAFALIHKRVFERIAGGPMPPFEDRAGGPPPNFFRWEGALGEDLRFCQDAKAAGARIFVDTRIEIGHVAEIEIRRKHFLLELLGRDAETVVARQNLNEEMGLPSLSTEQIKQRLGWT